MLYTEDFSMYHYVRFLKIGLHILTYMGHWAMRFSIALIEIYRCSIIISRGIVDQ